MTFMDVVTIGCNTVTMTHNEASDKMSLNANFLEP